VLNPLCWLEKWLCHLFFFTKSSTPKINRVETIMTRVMNMLMWRFFHVCVLRGDTFCLSEINWGSCRWWAGGGKMLLCQSGSFLSILAEKSFFRGCQVRVGEGAARPDGILLLLIRSHQRSTKQPNLLLSASVPSRKQVHRAFLTFFHWFIGL